MTTKFSPTVTYFRWTIFLLALGFWFYQFTQTSLDAFGWQFRFLTIWGLTANLVVSWMMLRLVLGKSTKTYNPLVSATVVLGAIVVFMYWKLWIHQSGFGEFERPDCLVSGVLPARAGAIFDDG